MMVLKLWRLSHKRNAIAEMASATASCEIWAAVLVGIVLGSSSPVRASSTVAVNPAVQFGNGTVSGLGTSQVTVNQTTQVLGINWASLGNNPGEVLRFIQPSASAVALNRVVGSDPSQILGSLTANGSVILINPNGVFFGPASQVNVNGLIASSLNITDADYLSGRYAFQGTAANGLVRNEGQITAGPFGVYLLAPNVTNNGVITSPGGQIALTAGTTAYLSNRADGRGFLVQVTAPAGEALNLKELVADGGQVSMIGRLVTQSGLVQANSVRQQNGKIELIASERVSLTAGSVTKATGDAQGVSNAGSVLVKSDLTSGQVTFDQGAVLDISGGIEGGNGGSAELSAASVTLGGQFTARALAGYTGGRFLIDPTVGTQTVSTADLQSFSGSGASDVEFRAPAGTDLTVSANYNLAPVFDPTSGALLSGWALPVGQTGFLRFTAGNNLIFSPNTVIQNGAISGAKAGVSNAAWNYVLSATKDIAFNSTMLFSGGGGSLTLNAGRDIKLVPDAGGGPTTLQTFTGGNMSIIAGRDLIAPSAFPTGVTPGPSSQYSGIRLEGTGNLTITTGRDFLGGIVNGVQAGAGFVLSDGTAQVTVGGTLGASTSYANFTVGTVLKDPVSRLGLTSVNITAQNNIYLGLIQDRGLSDRILRQPATIQVTANPNSSINILSQQGSIYLKPPDPGVPNFGDIRRSIYPASFMASAPNGNIFVQAGLQFWSSPVGTLSFLAGQSIQGTSSQTAGITLYCPGDVCNPITAPASQNLSPITLTAGTGDISGLNLHLVDSYRKTVNISAGGNIRDVFGVLAVPDLGTDAAGNLMPAVTIAAKGNLDLSGQSGLGSGFLFGGTGLARLYVGGTLDLGASRGLVFQFDPHLNSAATNASAANKGGLLDVAVGGDLNMTKSRIISWNGAGLFMHGLAAQVPIAGTTAMATSAVLGVVTVNGRTVLAVAGNPVLGTDGATLIPVNGSTQSLIGSSVYVVGGRTVLDSSGLPVVVGTNDAVLGKAVLVVDGKAALGLNGKPIAVDASLSGAVVSAGDLVHGGVVLDRPLVQLPDGTVVLVTNGKTVFSTPSGAGSVDGRPNLSNGTVALAVDGQPVSVINPLGGKVNVGTNQNSVDDQTGILTVRGGAIDLKATGDVNVNLSRIATLGGGDITLTSTTGNINAGTGARTDVTNFIVQQPDPTVTGGFRKVHFQVPGSGIFTYHPRDGNLPNVPFFNPLSPLEAQIALHQFFGHDTSKLEPLVPAAHEAWVNQYKQSVNQLFAGFHLGDITLTAAHDVIVPPAGIRGRHVTINAGHNLELQGGTIGGISVIKANGFPNPCLACFQGVPNITVAGPSGSTTFNLNQITTNVGSVTTTPAVTASTSTASVTSSKAAEDASSSQPVGEPRAASDRTGKQKSQQAPSASLRIKDRVKIKVETKPEPAM